MRLLKSTSSKQLFRFSIRRFISYDKQQRVNSSKKIGCSLNNNMKKDIEILSTNDDVFKINQLLSIDKLFDARLHWGHKQQLLHPKMAPYVYGVRHDTCVINLVETYTRLERALQFAAHIARKGGIILFASPFLQFELLVQSAARFCNQFYATRLWQHETLLHPSYHLHLIDRHSGMSSKSFPLLPDLIILHGIGSMPSHERPVPTAFSNEHDMIGLQVGFYNVSEKLLREAHKCCIPVVALVDTDCDPSDVTYVVPGNDDSPSSVEYFFTTFSKVIQNANELEQKLNS